MDVWSNFSKISTFRIGLTFFSRKTFLRGEMDALLALHLHRPSGMKMSVVQVILFQKLLFLHQLTHNMTADFSLITNSKLRTCCVQKLFLTFGTISVHMFSPCSAKRRASDKNLPAQSNEFSFRSSKLIYRRFRPKSVKKKDETQT